MMDIECDNPELIPSLGTKLSAGIDLKSPIDEVIPANSRKLIKLNLKIALPKNTYGQIAPRSSMAMKGIDIGGGIIDEDYRGELGVILINSTNTDYHIEQYQRIAQLIVIPYVRIENLNQTILSDTERGSGGFGSTGK